MENGRLNQKKQMYTEALGGKKSLTAKLRKNLAFQ